MNSQTTRRQNLLLIGLSALSVVSVTACGGDANYTSTELYAAYDVIEIGFSYQLVRSIIGSDPSTQEAVKIDASASSNTDSTQIIYRWETDKGTRLYTTLLVQIDSKLGVIRKVITGPSGNKSQT
jgi:hypothetical protein